VKYLVGSEESLIKWEVKRAKTKQKKETRAHVETPGIRAFFMERIPGFDNSTKSGKWGSKTETREYNPPPERGNK